MNKTILISLSIFALGSCTEVNPDGPGNNEEAENFGQQVQRVQEGSKYDNVIREFEYKGHQYIWFEQSIRQGYAGYGFAGVVHNPDCKCFKK